MEVPLAITCGLLYAAGTYLILRRNLMQLVLGLALLGHAANLLIFTAAGLERGRPALVPPEAVAPTGPTADPVPQALVLTAIVIGLGVLAFALVLVQQVHAVLGTDDVDDLDEGGR